MTDHEFGDLRRAATALRTGLQEQAESVRFTPLSAEEVANRAPRRPVARARWISVGVGVAAVASAIALLVPSTLGDRSITATPAPRETPGTGPTGVPTAPAAAGWQPVSTPPLSPRRDAVTAWVEGTYLLVGGFGDPPCADSGDCPDPAQPLRDGARYDPVTDSWQRIADAPAGVAWPGAFFFPVAVVDGTVYVGGSAFETIWSYDVPTDSWEAVPAPTEPGVLLAVGGKLVNVPWYSAEQGFSYDTYDPAGRGWTSHSPAVELPAEAVQSSVGVGAVGDQLALMANAATMREGDTLWAGLIDLATGGVTDLGWTQVPLQRAASTTVGGLLSWPRGSFDPAATDARAWFLDPDTMDWSSVDLPATARGLRWSIGASQRDWYLTTGTAIALRGRLYDPVAKTWTEVPDLPVPDHDPVVIGGADSVLACFGYNPEVERYGGGCELLRLS